MKGYKPSSPFLIPLKLLIPHEEKINGVVKKDFEEGDIIFTSFKTYGGTETTKNGIYSIIDPAVIETWFRPDIKSNYRIMTESGTIYEIINEPENINMRNQYLKFKAQRVKGGA